MNEQTINQDDVEFLRNIRRDYAALAGSLVFTGNNTFGGTSVFNGNATFNSGFTAGGGTFNGGVNVIGPASVEVLSNSGGQTMNIVVHAAAGTGASAALLNSNDPDNLDPPQFYSGDLAGTIQLMTGTSPTANGVLFTVTFLHLNTDVPTPRIILTPFDKVTTNAVWGATKTPIIVPGNNSFDVLSNDTPLNASTTHLWNYFVTL